MNEQSNKARARTARFNAFNASVRIREDNSATRATYQAISEQILTAHQKREIKDGRKRAAGLAAVQRSGGSNLYVDSYLRHFVSEYNVRMFQGEGLHMPSSFNIMSSFIEPDEQAMVLKLLEQQENVMSFNRMLDRITDPSVDTSLSSAVADLDELTIYEINMLGGHAEFKIPGNEAHVFCGLAICREGSDVSLLGVFGRSNPTPNARRKDLSSARLNPEKGFLSAHMKDADFGDQPLFGDDSYLPIILMARVDVVSGAVQSRIVMEESKAAFNVFSDDPDDIAYILSSTNASSGTVDNILSKIDACSSLFEILFTAPSCLSLMDDDAVGVERHPTKLRLEPNGEDAKAAAALKVSDAPKYVRVNTLYDLGASDFPTYTIPASKLKIETAGHWRNLGFGQAGVDKVGNAVQGKTWVTTQKSWVEQSASSDNPYDRPSTIEPVAEESITGWIYVMRNAMHGKDIYKVGFTTKMVDERAAQLGNTSGQIDMFNVVQSWHVRAPRVIEHEVHELLKSFRLNSRRELFQLKYEKIREVIERVIFQASAELPDGTA